MDPRTVAGLIKHHHERLAAMLVDLERMIDRMVAEDAGATADFYARCGDLLRALLQHIDLEDAALVPLLREHHPQGEAEAADLLRHHRAQRAWLTEVLVRRGAPLTTDTLGAVRALTHVLRADMDHEEAVLRALVQMT